MFESLCSLQRRLFKTCSSTCHVNMYCYSPYFKSSLLLVHGQVTIIFVVSVCLSVCLCRVFLSRLRSDLDQTSTRVTCPGLVMSPRIWGCATPGGWVTPKNCIFRGLGAAVNHHSVAASCETFLVSRKLLRCYSYCGVELILHC